MIELDAEWRAAHPLPCPSGEVSKNSRGRVLVVGGTTGVPGAVRLTAEAALRVGAGKVQIATIGSAALLLGVLFPEIRVVALAEDERGEIAPDPPEPLLEALARVDAAVIGPGMVDKKAAAELLRPVLGADPVPLVLDAAAVACSGRLEREVSSHGAPVVLTPHPGEMAALLGCDGEEVIADLPRCAREAAARFRAVVVLKSSETVIARPEGQLIHYPGGGVGLATGGSGDVLAGAIAGLLARGAGPMEAAAWGVWLHGEAGRVLAGESGPLGFLGRELLPVLPRLLPR